MDGEAVCGGQRSDDEVQIAAIPTVAGGRYIGAGDDALPPTCPPPSSCIAH